MITLALAQLVYFTFLQAPFTGAEDGMQPIPRGVLFGIVDLNSDFNLYFVVLVCTAGGLWLVHRIVHSPSGRSCVRSANMSRVPARSDMPWSATRLQPSPFQPGYPVLPAHSNASCSVWHP